MFSKINTVLQRNVVFSFQSQDKSKKYRIKPCNSVTFYKYHSLAQHYYTTEAFILRHNSFDLVCRRCWCGRVVEFITINHGIYCVESHSVPLICNTDLYWIISADKTETSHITLLSYKNL